MVACLKSTDSDQEVETPIVLSGERSVKSGRQSEEAIPSARTMRPPMIKTLLRKVVDSVEAFFLHLSFFP